MSYALEQAAALRQRLANPAKIVVAPGLYPTPPRLAAMLCEAVDLQPGLTLLEPSCGTGELIAAARQLCPRIGFIQGVEVNLEVAKAARRALDAEASDLIDVWHGDFLECYRDVGSFDRVIMNPPFGRGIDIAHVLRAQECLKPGGKLAAICASGPRQQEALGRRGRFTVLEPGWFAHLGTQVRVAMVVMGPK